MPDLRPKNCDIPSRVPATAIAEGLLRDLADPDRRIQAEVTISEWINLGRSGDESLAPGALTLVAELVARDSSLPIDARTFARDAMLAAAGNRDLVKAIAGTTGKPGARAKASRDGLYTWLWLFHLKPRGISQREAAKLIGEEFADKPDAVREVIKALVKQQRKGERAIRDADRLIAQSSSEDA